MSLLGASIKRRCQRLPISSTCIGPYAENGEACSSYDVLEELGGKGGVRLVLFCFCVLVIVENARMQA